MSVKSVRYTWEDLLHRAESLIEQLEFEPAAKFLQRALEMSPNNVVIMDLLADAWVELGQQEQALQLLQKSVKIAPEENPAKWMNLAQLQTGMEALASFQRGLEMLSNEKLKLENSNQSEETIAIVNTLNSQICSGLCSMVELYTTDCCDEPQAESECERLLAYALTVNPNSIEVNQTITNLRLIQQRVDDAKIYLLKTLELLSSSREDENRKEIPYAFRMETMKMCYELEVFDHCADLAEDLLEENDEELQVWYFAGMAYLKQSPPDIPSAVEYLTHTLNELNKTNEDPELAQEISEMIGGLDPMQN